MAKEQVFQIISCTATYGTYGTTTASHLFKVPSTIRVPVTLHHADSVVLSFTNPPPPNTYCRLDPAREIGLQPRIQPQISASALYRTPQDTP